MSAGPIATPATDMSQEAGFRPLSSRVVQLWRAALLLWTLVLAGGAATAAAMTAGGRYPALAAAAVGATGVVLAVLWPPVRYRSWGFAVRDDDVVIRRGVWWRTMSIVPHARIQHVDTTHGPLERSLGLASVVLYTAGTVGASITIPGLPVAEADELRDRLAALGRAGEAV